MKLLLAIAALVLMAGAASAQTTTTSSTSTSTSSSTSSSTSTLIKALEAGVLSTSQARSGQSDNIVCLSKEGGKALVIDIVGTSTPSATFFVEHSMAGVAWSPLTTPSFVVMTGIALSTGTPNASIEIPAPVGCYRTDATTYATGNFAINYQILF